MKKTREDAFMQALKTTGLTAGLVRRFRSTVYAHYRAEQRAMPWRTTQDPYRILVSEVMLQQTQVERVLVKYPEFLLAFPGFPELAAATLTDVLRVWQGMGYNRRALALKKTAEAVMTDYGGKLPLDEAELRRLPGIGPYSAAAICAFAGNKQAVFIETNIRRVYIHFFFQGREQVRDAEILPLLERTLDRRNPREWYYALMDYGTKLKKEVNNPNLRSAHYARQTRFEGSARQVRAMVLRMLLREPGLTAASIRKSLPAVPVDLGGILRSLRDEGLIEQQGSRYVIAESEGHKKGGKAYG